MLLQYEGKPRPPRTGGAEGFRRTGGSARVARVAAQRRLEGSRPFLCDARRVVGASRTNGCRRKACAPPLPAARAWGEPDCFVIMDATPAKAGIQVLKEDRPRG